MQRGIQGEMCRRIARNGEDISVVVRGAVERAVYVHVAKSIRHYLPKAEIVLSTWEGTNVIGLDYDEIVINKDPGCLKSYYYGNDKMVINNINRQIVSTLNGIKKAKRKYIMKLRSDSIITGCGFLKYADKYLDDKKYLCFEPRNPWGNFKSEYCLCDFWFFGRKEAIFKLWNIPLYQKKRNQKYDLMTEEYLVKCTIVPKSVVDIEQNKYVYILKNYAVIIPTKESGILSLKYPDLNKFDIVYIKHYVLSHLDWKQINGKASIVERVINCFSLFSGWCIIKIKKLIKSLKTNDI